MASNAAVPGALVATRSVSKKNVKNSDAGTKATNGAQEGSRSSSPPLNSDVDRSPSIMPGRSSTRGHAAAHTSVSNAARTAEVLTSANVSASTTNPALVVSASSSNPALFPAFHALASVKPHASIASRDPEMPQAIYEGELVNASKELIIVNSSGPMGGGNFPLMDTPRNEPMIIHSHATTTPVHSSEQIFENNSSSRIGLPYSLAGAPRSEPVSSHNDFQRRGELQDYSPVRSITFGNLEDNCPPLINCISPSVATDFNLGGEQSFSNLLALQAKEAPNYSHISYQPAMSNIQHNSGMLNNLNSHGSAPNASAFRYASENSNIVSAIPAPRKYSQVVEGNASMYKVSPMLPNEAPQVTLSQGFYNSNPLFRHHEDGRFKGSGFTKDKGKQPASPVKNYSKSSEAAERSIHTRQMFFSINAIHSWCYNMEQRALIGCLHGPRPSAEFLRQWIKGNWEAKVK